MTENIQRLATVMLIGFIVIAIALVYWQVVRGPALTRDPILNLTRLAEAESLTKRGPITDRNGVILGWSEQTANGWERRYANPSLVHVIGYHSMRFGNSNVEESFDDYLRGEKGLDPAKLFQSRLLHRSTEGNKVVLTIDARLQKVADAALGTDAGAVVALNPMTGEILALASHPYFDPNSMEQDWEKLRVDQGTPLFNRATQGLYAPGSTFKTVTLALALENGLTRPDELFEYPMRKNEQGQWYHDELVKGFRIYDANHGPTEDQRAVLDLAHAYAVSCNVAFADLGLRLGAKRITEGAERFGFDQAIPIDLPASISRLGVNGIAKGDPALASTAFGQGELQVSPLQMALVAGTVANGGLVPKPHVVSAVDGSAGQLWHYQPDAWRRAISPETASTVAAMMITSAEEGWAKTGLIPGVKVAAKTGTAETVAGEQSHAWFIAYAPADRPQIAVAVIKEHAGGGATEAGPAAKQVMQAALELFPANP